jgi:DNA modification methylase
MPKADIYVGDALEVLKGLPSDHVQCVVTSPPYWGLRDYGEDGQIGLESTPGEYVQKLVGVYRELRRVLRGDGTLWLNLGDSYYAGGWECSRRNQVGNGSMDPANRRSGRHAPGLKVKDLCMMPSQVAMALQEDGWWVRSRVVWVKGNPMPESVTDRPTSSHEYIFLLSKSKHYFYDHYAILEPLAYPDAADGTRVFGGKQGPRNAKHGDRTQARAYSSKLTGKNKRDVWKINTRPFSKAHFAVFPPDLAEPPILAGTSAGGQCAECGAPFERIIQHVEEEPVSHKGSNFHTGKTATHQEGRASTKARTRAVPTNDFEPVCDCDAGSQPQIVLDPFSGAGTTGLVALAKGRGYIGIELNPEYAEMSAERIRKDAPLLNHVEVHSR